MLEYDSIRNEFRSRGKELEAHEYETAHRELLARIETICKVAPGGTLGDTKIIREYSLLLRQLLLHRAIKLFEGAMSAMTLHNVYTMVLAIRGHFETTGALGYLHNRLQSLSQGNLDSKVVDQYIRSLILGRRDRTVPQPLEAKQILTLLEYADHTVSKNVLGGTTKQYDILTDRYKFLCEFAHPNFYSNSIAFDFNKDKQEFTIRHLEPMQDSEFELVEDLLTSSYIFIILFDKIGDVLP